MRLEEEGRNCSADLPPEEDHRARADLSAAGIALGLHRLADRTQTSLPLMEMVQWGKDARETPAAGVVGLAGCQSLGVSEDGGEMKRVLILVHLLPLLFRVLVEVGEQALHLPLVGN